MAEKQGVTYTDLSIEKADGTHLNYSLCFDFNILCDVETEIGLNLNHAIMRSDLCSGGQIRAILYAMLKTAQPKITLAVCCVLFSADYRAVNRAIANELMAALHEDTVDTVIPVPVPTPVPVPAPVPVPSDSAAA
jgi:hypothetical protein